MTASVGTLGLSSAYKVGDSAMTETFTALAQVQKITGPNGTGDSVDVTNMDSPSGIREKIAGLWDSGKVSMDIVHKKATRTTLLGLIRSKKNYQIAWADGSSDTFTAIMTGLGLETPHDGAMMSNAEFDISGAVNNTPGA